MSQEIPLIKSSHIQPFISVLTNIGSPVNSLLNKANLSTEISEEPSKLVSEINVWKFLHIASKTQGIEQFGYLATENIALSEFGGLGEHIVKADSLYAALQSFLIEVELHCPNIGKPENKSYFWLTEDSGDVWFCRRGLAKNLLGSWQAELHVITFMINMIRIFTDKSWQPTTILLQNSAKDTQSALGLFESSHLKHNHKFTAINFPKSFLGHNNLEKSQNTSFKQLVQLEHHIEDILLSTNDMASISTELVADLCGISTRSMQRRLQNEGTSFRLLIDEVKVKKAKGLLSNTEEKIQAISVVLGYADSSHFVRAFKRSTGLTPSEYRRYSVNY